MVCLNGVYVYVVVKVKVFCRCVLNFVILNIDFLIIDKNYGLFYFFCNVSNVNVFYVLNF